MYVKAELNVVSSASLLLNLNRLDELLSRLVKLNSGMHVQMTFIKLEYHLMWSVPFSNFQNYLNRVMARVSKRKRTSEEVNVETELGRYEE